MVPRTCRMSFGVDPSAGPDVEKYSTPLMLRWIARCTSDWMRSGIDARSRPAGLDAGLAPGLAFISALRRRTAGGGRLARGGLAAPPYPLPDAAALLFI